MKPTTTLPTSIGPVRVEARGRGWFNVETTGFLDTWPSVHMTIRRGDDGWESPSI